MSIARVKFDLISIDQLTAEPEVGKMAQIVSHVRVGIERSLFLIKVLNGFFEYRIVEKGHNLDGSKFVSVEEGAVSVDDWSQFCAELNHRSTSESSAA